VYLSSISYCQENTEVVDRVGQVWNKGNLTEVLLYCSSEIEIELGEVPLPFGGNYKGHQGFIEFATLVGQATEFPQGYQHRVMLVDAPRGYVITYSSSTIQAKSTAKLLSQQHLYTFWTLRAGKVSHVKFQYADEGAVVQLYRTAAEIVAHEFLHSLFTGELLKLKQKYWTDDSIIVALGPSKIPWVGEWRGFQGLASFLKSFNNQQVRLVPHNVITMATSSDAACIKIEESVMRGEDEHVSGVECYLFFQVKDKKIMALDLYTTQNDKILGILSGKKVKRPKDEAHKNQPIIEQIIV